MEKKAEANEHLVEIREALKSGSTARRLFACPFEDEAGLYFSFFFFLFFSFLFSFFLFLKKMNQELSSSKKGAPK